MYEDVKDIRALWLVFSFASVKNRDYTMHRSDYMSGKTKRVEIWQKSSWNILTKLMFWAETFFKDFQNFFVAFSKIFKVCVCFLEICLPFSNKIMKNMAQQSDYIWVKVKKVDILKNETQNRVGIFWQTSCFEQIFFWRLL